MDPDLTLEQMMLCIETIQSDKPVSRQAFAQASYELAELVQGLDEWIAKGGYLPRLWRQR